MWRKHRHTNNTVIHVEVGLKKLIYSTNKHEKKNLPTNEHQSKMTNSLSTCIVVGILIIILMLVITTAISLAFRIKSSTNSTPELRWNTTGITVAGGSTNMSNKLLFPVGITLDYANNLYIAGNFTNSSSLYQLANPTHTIMDENGNFYISDAANHRVLFWRNDAISGTIVAGTGSPGNGNNQLKGPYDVARNPTSSTLYIADFYNHRLMAYNKNATSSTMLLGSGSAGLTSITLYYPVGLYFDSFSNSLIIANYGAHNIVRYTSGSNAWTLIAGNINGDAGNTSTTFNNPINAVLDPMGNMYVADRSNYRVQFFRAGESIGSTIAGITGVSGSGPTKLAVLSFVALDSQLNVYVADSSNGRIQKFLRY